MLLGRKTDRAAEQTYADNGEFSKHRRGLNRKGASIESLEAEFAVTDNNEFLERPTKRPRVWIQNRQSERLLVLVLVLVDVPLPIP